jgi:hypothetical protein
MTARIHLNATAAYEILKHVYVGASGYYLKQITDARANGLALPNSLQQIGAIGPGAVINHGTWYFYINGYHEIGAENMSAGNKLILPVERSLVRLVLEETGSLRTCAAGSVRFQRLWNQSR